MLRLFTKYAMNVATIVSNGILSHGTFWLVAIPFFGALQAWIKVEAKDINGYTPLHLAAAIGHLECVDCLLRVCVACSCFALSLVPSADQVRLFCLIVGFGLCEWVPLGIIVSAGWFSYILAINFNKTVAHFVVNFEQRPCQSQT